MSRIVHPPSVQSATRWQIFSWALFDFAHTSFYVIILTVGYPLYFKEIVAQGSKQGDFLWGLAFSISMTLVALMSPVLGAAADYGAGKKRFLGILHRFMRSCNSVLIFYSKFDGCYGNFPVNSCQHRF